MAKLAASLLTLVSLGCGSLGLWRIAADLDLAGEFVFQRGLLSHWQVWTGVAIVGQYTSWRLARYARTAAAPPREDETPASIRAAANG